MIENVVDNVLPAEAGGSPYEFTVYPVRAVAPQGGWENVENAAGYDCATFAITRSVPSGQWAPELYLEFPRSRAVSALMRIYAADWQGVAELQGWNGYEWITLRVAGPYPETRNLGGLGASFDRVWLSRLRIQIRWSTPGTHDFQAHCGYLRAVCGGPLAPICSIFHNIGDWFSGLADDISDVFIIGEHLAAPFRWAGSTFHDLGDTCCEVSGKLQDILDALQEGISLENFAALLERYFPLLYYLVVDTPGQVRYLIAQAFNLTPYEAQSAEFIIKTLFERWFPSLYLLWRDPQMTLAGWLERYFPPLYYLIVDPAGQMRYLVAQLFDLTPYEARTPEMIVKVLFERYFPELYLIWRDPIRWLVDMLLSLEEEIVRPIADKLQKLGEHLLRLMWEGEW